MSVPPNARGCALDATPVIDLGALEQLQTLGGDDEGAFVADIIDEYVRAAPGQLNAIAHALERGDAKAVDAAAHRLKGGSGSLGATRVLLGCAAMEAAAARDDLEAAREAMVTLRGDVVDAIATLSERAAKLTVGCTGAHRPQWFLGEPPNPPKSPRDF